MQARLSAFLVWALVAAGVAFWGLRLMVRAAPLPSHVQTVDARAVAAGDFTRMLGAAPVVQAEAPVAAAESNRFKLLGVLAPAPDASGANPSQGGVALIAVDGRPARPYRVGAELDGGFVVLGLGRRSASIGPKGGAASVVLELPPPAPPATGTLPAANAGFAPVAPQVVQEAADAQMQIPPQRGDEPRTQFVR